MTCTTAPARNVYFIGKNIILFSLSTVIALVGHFLMQMPHETPKDCNPQKTAGSAVVGVWFAGGGAAETVDFENYDGTGSGKTECFLIPIIHHLLHEVEDGELDFGVRAILIYPMNALANDQMKRLRKLFRYYPKITFGVYNSSTKEKEKQKRMRKTLSPLSRI